MIQMIPYNSFIDQASILTFDCGEAILTRFFHQQAGEIEKIGLGTTVIFFDDQLQKIIGFYTISIHELDLKEFQPYKRATPFISDALNSLEIRHIPVLEILRFAVAKEFQDQYVGTSIIKEIYQAALDLKLKYFMPFNLLYLESLADATEFYQSVGFEFAKYSDDEQRLDHYPMLISLEKIAEIIY